jgi:hypothetical protein
MSVRVTCPGCGASLKFKDKYAGQRGVCPECRGALDVPALEGADDVRAEPEALSRRPPSSINDPNWLDDIADLAPDAPAAPSAAPAGDSSWLDGLEDEVIDAPPRTGAGASASVIKLDIESGSSGSSIDRTARLRFRCPRCNGVLKAPGHLAGRKARCQHCQHAVRVPGGESASDSRLGSPSGIGLAGPPPIPPRSKAQEPERKPPEPAKPKPSNREEVRSKVPPPLPKAKPTGSAKRVEPALTPLFDELSSSPREAPIVATLVPSLRKSKPPASQGIPWWIWPIVGCGVVMVGLLLVATVGLDGLRIVFSLAVGVSFAICFFYSLYLMLTRGMPGTAVLSFILAPCCGIGYVWSLVTVFRKAEEWNLVRFPAIFGALTILHVLVLVLNIALGLGDSFATARQRAIEHRDAERQLQLQEQEAGMRQDTPTDVLIRPRRPAGPGTDPTQAAEDLIEEEPVVIPRRSPRGPSFMEQQRAEQALRDEFEKTTTRELAEMKQRVEEARAKMDQAQGAEARHTAVLHYQEEFGAQMELQRQINHRRVELEQPLHERRNAARDGLPQTEAANP